MANDEPFVLVDFHRWRCGAFTHAMYYRNPQSASGASICSACDQAARQGKLVQQSVSTGETKPVCRVCGGYGYIAQKRTLDDGWGEAEPCPEPSHDVPNSETRPASPVAPHASSD